MSELPVHADVICEADGAVARIRLNRPKALHALTTAMCRTMLDALVGWQADEAIRLILLDHAQGRGFCAGGDVRAIAADPSLGPDFFGTEYRLNHRLFTSMTPIVSFLDGVTMGGGVGIGLPCRWRVATERTVLAMPETTIGLFPDVGGGWYLSRLPGRIGQYLALTGTRLDGAECFALGLATHYVPSDNLDDLKLRLAAQPDRAEAILEEFSAPAPDAAILGQREAIDRLFASDNYEEILAALDADGSDWAKAQLATLAPKSPQSCKVSLELLRRSAGLGDFADEMAMEYGLAVHVCARPDFAEGVRALLVDKDNSPRWDPPTPAGVTPALLDALFAPPEGGQWAPA
ncbi:enoyl-CoA hydratase/isomerase family protein [Sphingomonas quercus]|uniref:Enoyl-CoA hydratase/isomerase family protein n=1 Tax=Sphingomonas quercus TaxID=2842451 RepID=A0ABS6BJM3_9SPHN|nr:enoyl-CoA hydratase/isomerase family protein [Sphingomonas quercus]MBU3078511.1 enoyl-CoA hydratase/isomerase family protein [Sphingomonas quercus]